MKGFSVEFISVVTWSMSNFSCFGYPTSLFVSVLSKTSVCHMTATKFENLRLKIQS